MAHDVQRANLLSLCEIKYDTELVMDDFVWKILIFLMLKSTMILKLKGA